MSNFKTKASAVRKLKGKENCENEHRETASFMYNFVQKTNATKQLWWHFTPSSPLKIFTPFSPEDPFWKDDLICTTPRLCQNNMTPVAVRGRGTTSTYNCFPATGLYFKSKVLASVGRDSTETTRLQHGSSMFGDTHAKGGGGGSSGKHGYMAFLILAKWEWQVEDLCRPDNAPC